MIGAGATCLCLTAGKLLIFDREKMLRLADDHKIAVVAVGAETNFMSAA
jgi:DUF1009 family protein